MSRGSRHNTVARAALGGLLVASACTVAIAAPRQIASAAAAVVGDGTTRATAGTSCWGVKQAFPASPDGVYWLQTSVMQAPEAFRCDMTTDGGGWVLVGRGREGWTFDEKGQGTPAQVRNAVAGRGAFVPAALSSTTIDRLVGNRAIRDLADGIRLVRATTIGGKATQTITWRLLDLGAWSWSVDGGHRLKSATVDGVTRTGSNTRDSRQTVAGEVGVGNRSVNDRRRWITWSVATNDDQKGFAYGTEITGSPGATSRLWTPVAGGTAPIAFTQVWLRPRLANVTRARIADVGLPASTAQPGIAPTTIPLHGGVTGVLKDGDTDPLIDSPVLALAEWGSTIFVGGKFANVQTGLGAPLQAQSYLAAFDRTTGAWISTFRPTLNGTVWDLAVTPGGLLIVAGQFTLVNDEIGAVPPPVTPHAGLVALDPATGEIVPDWSATVRLTCGGGASCLERASVRALDIQDGWLYLGGNFTRLVNPVNALRDDPGYKVSRLARVNVADGTIFATGNPVRDEFRPVFNAPVFDVDATPTRVNVAGMFTRVDETDVASFAVIDTVTGALVSGMAPMVQTTTVPEKQYQQAVVQVGDVVWHGGSEHNIHAYRASDHALLRGWITGRVGGDPQAMVASGNTVYVASHVNSHIFADTVVYPGHGGYTRVDQARWVTAFNSATLQHDRGFVLDAQSRNGEGAWELLVDSTGCLWAGGDFKAGSLVNGVRRYGEGFVKVCRRDSTAPTTPTEVALLTTPTQRQITWRASADNSLASPIYEVLRDNRVIAEVTTTSFVDTDLASPARYFVRAVDATGNRSATTAVAGPDTAKPTTPGSVTATRLDAASARITWTASTDNVGVVGYRVFVDTVNKGRATGLTLDVGGLTPGQHSVQILAFDAAGNVSARTTPVLVTL